MTQFQVGKEPVALSLVLECFPQRQGRLVFSFFFKDNVMVMSQFTTTYVFYK